MISQMNYNSRSVEKCSSSMEWMVVGFFGSERGCSSICGTIAYESWLKTYIQCPVSAVYCIICDNLLVWSMESMVILGHTGSVRMELAMRRAELNRMLMIANIDRGILRNPSIVYVGDTSEHLLHLLLFFLNFKFKCNYHYWTSWGWIFKK
jgi:hypothetical protein